MEPTKIIFTVNLNVFKVRNQQILSWPKIKIHPEWIVSIDNVPSFVDPSSLEFYFNQTLLTTEM